MLEISREYVSLARGAEVMTTTIEAVYERGVLRPKEPLALEEGAEVEITINAREPNGGDERQATTPTDLADLLTQCEVDTGIPDLAQQHDHYLYGTPKKD